MNKYYFSKTNDNSDSSQAANSEKAIIMNGTQVNFYKNGELFKSSSTNTPASLIQTRKANFMAMRQINNNVLNQFFNNQPGEKHDPYDDVNVNAFAYIRHNNIGNVDNMYRWPQ